MPIFDPIRPLCRLALGLVLAGWVAEPGLAQTTVGVPCTVRIRPRAAGDYDPSSEVLLHGQVIGVENGLILLRLPAGVVRVDVGSWEGQGTREGRTSVEILACKCQSEGRQRFLAREIRHAGGCVTLRDARGVPVQL